MEGNNKEWCHFVLRVGKPLYVRVKIATKLAPLKHDRSVPSGKDYHLPSGQASSISRHSPVMAFTNSSSHTVIVGI